MKIKNFRMGHRMATKIATYVLMGTLTATSLTGCLGKQKSILQGTVLEDTCVVTFADGTKDVVRIYSDCRSGEYPHYFSIEDKFSVDKVVVQLIWFITRF